MSQQKSHLLAKYTKRHLGLKQGFTEPENMDKERKDGRPRYCFSTLLWGRSFNHLSCLAHSLGIMRFCVLAAFPHFLLFAWIPADELWIRVNYAPFPSFVIFSTHLHFHRLWHSPRASYFTWKDWFCKNTQPIPTHFCKIHREKEETRCWEEWA